MYGNETLRVRVVFSMRTNRSHILYLKMEASREGYCVITIYIIQEYSHHIISWVHCLEGWLYTVRFPRDPVTFHIHNSHIKDQRAIGEVISTRPKSMNEYETKFYIHICSAESIGRSQPNADSNLLTSLSSSLTRLSATLHLHYKRTTDSNTQRTKDMTE